MNQLRAELDRFWPGPLGLLSHIDAEILLAFLERYPSPQDARGLGVARMHAFLVREHYSGGQHPTELMAKLRAAPQARVGELELTARRQIVLTDVAMIRTSIGRSKTSSGRSAPRCKLTLTGGSSSRCSSHRPA